MFPKQNYSSQNYKQKIRLEHCAMGSSLQAHSSAWLRNSSTRSSPRAGGRGKEEGGLLYKKNYSGARRTFMG